MASIIYMQYLMEVIKSIHYLQQIQSMKSLKDHGKGTEAIITKLAAQRGKKLVTTYDVQIVGNGKVDSSESSSNA